MFIFNNQIIASDKELNINNSPYKMYYLPSLQAYYVISMLFFFHGSGEKAVKLINIYLNYLIVFCHYIYKKNINYFNVLVDYLITKDNINSLFLLNFSESLKKNYYNKDKTIILSIDKLAECYESLLVITFGDYYLKKIYNLLKKEEKSKDNCLGSQVLFGCLAQEIQSINVLLDIFLHKAYNTNSKNFRASSLIKETIQKNYIIEKLINFQIDILRIIQDKRTSKDNKEFFANQIVSIIKKIFHLYKYSRNVKLLITHIKISKKSITNTQLIMNIKKHIISLSKKPNNTDKIDYVYFISKLINKKEISFFNK